MKKKREGMEGEHKGGREGGEEKEIVSVEIRGKQREVALIIGEGGRQY